MCNVKAGRAANKKPAEKVSEPAIDPKVQWRLDEVFEALRAARHHVDWGTGSAVAGVDDNDCAVRNRLTAHENLSVAEVALLAIRDEITRVERAAKAVA